MWAAREGIEDDGDVDDHGGGDEGDERHDCPHRDAAAPEPAELDLDHVDEGQREEAAAQNGTDGGGDDPAAQQCFVDARRGAVVGADEADGLLEAQRDQAGEEKGGEGQDVEGD